MKVSYYVCLLVALFASAVIGASLSDDYSSTAQVENTIKNYPSKAPWTWSPDSSRQTVVNSVVYSKSNINSDSVGQAHVKANGVINYAWIAYNNFDTPLDISGSTSCIVTGNTNSYYGEVILAVTDTTALSSSFKANVYGSFTSNSATWSVSAMSAGAPNLASLAEVRIYVKGNVTNAIRDFYFDGVNCA